MINEILVGIIALTIASAVIVSLNRKFFSKTKNVSRKEVSVISLVSATVFVVGYWAQIFIIEGENISSSGGSGMSDVLPLFLFVFFMYLIFVAIPMSVAVVLIYPVFKKKRKK